MPSTHSRRDANNGEKGSFKFIQTLMSHANKRICQMQRMENMIWARFNFPGTSASISRRSSFCSRSVRREYNLSRPADVTIFLIRNGVDKERVAATAATTATT
jgi:hypothetical protein